jgi:Tfp pilus assembly protein PilE
MRSAAKGFIALAVIIALFFVLVYPSWLNVQQKEKEAKASLDEYILAVKELYGTDRSQWPKCIQDTIDYSNTHPLIRLIQQGGSTEMPDFCS